MTKADKLIKETVDAWEALPGGQEHTTRDVEKWLRRSMKPAIDELRTYLKTVKVETTYDRVRN